MSKSKRRSCRPVTASIRKITSNAEMLARELGVAQDVRFLGKQDHVERLIERFASGQLEAGLGRRDPPAVGSDDLDLSADPLAEAVLDDQGIGAGHVEGAGPARFGQLD